MTTGGAAPWPGRAARVGAGGAAYANGLVLVHRSMRARQVALLLGLVVATAVVGYGLIAWGCGLVAAATEVSHQAQPADAGPMAQGPAAARRG